MLPQLFLFVGIFLFLGNPSQENARYHKEYYPSGKMEAEGWLWNGAKTAYWKYYHPNGKLAEEGHFGKGQREQYWHFYTKAGNPEKEGHYTDGKRTDWWLFYDANGKIDHKCQMKNGKKNGYCLKYQNEKLTSAEKFDNGDKIKEWHSFSSFKRENNLSDLK